MFRKSVIKSEHEVVLRIGCLKWPKIAQYGSKYLQMVLLHTLPFRGKFCDAVMLSNGKNFITSTIFSLQVVVL